VTVAQTLIKKVPYPTLSDGPDGANVPYWIEAQATWLEANSPMYGQGALADRPVSTPAQPGIPGRRYLAQPENVEYVDHGLGWVAVNTSLVSDGPAGQATLRTLGTGAQQAAVGNDARLSDQRVPTDGSVSAAKVASTLKPSEGAGSGVEALRAIGASAGQVAAGNDARFTGAIGDYTIGGRLLLPASGAASGVLLGGDANLYRPAADRLKTDDTLEVAGDLYVNGRLIGGSELIQRSVLDVGMVGQTRAGRQLTVADFTNLGLSAPLGLWNLSNLTNLGSDGRALSNKGAVSFGAGINGLPATAAVFSGQTSQALYIPDSGAADPYRIRTGSWGCWFRSAKRGAAQYLMAKSGQVAGSYSWLLSVSATNAVRADVSGDGTSSVTANGVTDIADDRWHFVVITADGTTLRIYVDGVLEAAIPAATIFAGAGPFNIGSYGADAGTAAGNPHFGRSDEGFLLGDVATEDQLRCLYAASLPHSLGVTPGAVRLNVHRRRKGAPLAVSNFTTQPLRLYNFTGGALTDEGANGLTLTNYGGAVSVVGTDGTPGNAAYSFAGAQSLGASAAGLPGSSTPRSYGCWFKTITLASAGVLGWGVSSADARLHVAANGTLLCLSGADQITGPYVADGQWHFATVTEDTTAADGVKRKLYLDSRLVGGSAVLNNINLTVANLRIGSSPDASNPFTGQSGGVFILGDIPTQHVLTATDVAALYAKGAQDLGASPKNAGEHVERVDGTSVLFIGDTLESQHMIDLVVSA
jgi:hypothetical protein